MNEDKKELLRKVFRYEAVIEERDMLCFTYDANALNVVVCHMTMFYVGTTKI